MDGIRVLSHITSTPTIFPDDSLNYKTWSRTGVFRNGKPGGALQLFDFRVYFLGENPRAAGTLSRLI
jgi:hypothetical protein